MHELNPDQLDRILPLFDVPYARFVIESMQAGHTPARVWVDDAGAPRSALVWNTTHNLYFGGDAQNMTFNDALRTLIDSTITVKLPNLHIFKIHTFDENWKSLTAGFFPSLKLEEAARVLYKLDDDPAASSSVLPDEFHVVPIERVLMASNCANVDETRHEIEWGWGTLEHFFQHGFGFAVLHGDEIVCWCMAEYASDHQCGIGIETVEAYQKRGLAAAAAHAFVTRARAKDWTVYWDSWSANTPSIKVAEKVGFRKVEDYSVIVAWIESDD